MWCHLCLVQVIAEDKSGEQFPISLWMRPIPSAQPEPQCLAVIEPVERTTGIITSNLKVWTKSMGECDGMFCSRDTVAFYFTCSCAPICIRHAGMQCCRKDSSRDFYLLDQQVSQDSSSLQFQKVSQATKIQL